MEATYKLEELARAADVSPRTVRYYVQRGLLPGPAFRGRDTVYGAEHLLRLQAIRKLQDDYLPLDAILVELERRGPQAILGDAAGAQSKPRPAAPIWTRQPPFDPPPAMPPPGRSWRRHELRDGVELHVRDDVAPTVANLVSQLAQLLGKGQGGPYR